MPQATAARASGSDRTIGLRQRKQDKVRADLVEAGMRLFSKKGFDATTVDDIAEAANTSRRTLFRYFKTKGEVVLGWTRGMADYLADALASRPSTEFPLVSMREIFLAFTSHVLETTPEAYNFSKVIHKTPALSVLSLQKHAEWEDRLAKVLRTRLGKGPDNARVAILMARLGVATFRVAVDEWIAGNGKKDLQMIVRDVFELFEQNLTIGLANSHTQTAEHGKAKSS